MVCKVHGWVLWIGICIVYVAHLSFFGHVLIWACLHMSMSSYRHVVIPYELATYFCPTAAISIGFEQAEYTFTKGDGFHFDTIRLVKEGGVVSEQTFDVRVTAESSAVDNQAVHGVDYDLGGDSVLTFTIRPDQQYLPIAINIYDDGAVTGTKMAILISARSPSSVPYDRPHHPTTTIVILDNHGGFT